jgi:uncharacterized protein YbjT (DUF2867 family)
LGEAMDKPLSIVMLGASGAVGSHVVRSLCTSNRLVRLTLLVRRPLKLPDRPEITQHVVDVMNPTSYQTYLPGHHIAICTLGLGQPSKFTKQEFVRVDRDSVLLFARSCKQAQVNHFELLSAVGSNSKSSSFYLRTKGQLEDALKTIGFDRLSLFQPSMILTPTNHYGVSQAIVLAVWPHLNPLLVGSLRKYRGIAVEALGAAMANNLRPQFDHSNAGVEVLQWDQFIALQAN